MQDPYAVKPEQIKKEADVVKPEPTPPIIEGNDQMEKIYLAETLGVKDLGEIKKSDLQIQRLIDWAKAKGAESREDIAWQIRQLAARIGGPKLGDNNIKHLSVYAYLELERMRIDKQLKEYTNG